MVTTMNDRLKQFLAAENISQSQFADTIKVVRATVSHILAGRNKPGYDFIKAIMQAYPRLNMEWMIMGRGKMYKSEDDISPVITQANETSFMPAAEELPLLFGNDSEEYDEINAPSYDSYSSLKQPQPQQRKESNSTDTLADAIQYSGRQRKAIRVAVFYDDGTYQEFIHHQ